MALQDEIQELTGKVEQAFDRLDVLNKEETLKEYEKEMALPDFWTDSAIAQEVAKKHAKLEKQLKPWLELSKNLQELQELGELEDKAMHSELKSQLAKLQKVYDDLEFELNFSGPYDDHDALVSFQAGAGGTDAQDWAQMLQRMYSRWAEDHKFKT
ncbi:MAG: PCRF domain-containing protein, partial [Candidatus Saccharimonadales bacterium]|nr:PCRF domain-containing protein [Candidatus Saccharimonadales bacterium]